MFPFCSRLGTLEHDEVYILSYNVESGPERSRPLDVACLNAGVGVGGLFWETDLEVNAPATKNRSLCYPPKTVKHSDFDRYNDKAGVSVPAFSIVSGC